MYNNIESYRSLIYGVEKANQIFIFVWKMQWILFNI